MFVVSIVSIVSIVNIVGGVLLCEWGEVQERGEGLWVCSDIMCGSLKGVDGFVGSLGYVECVQVCPQCGVGCRGGFVNVGLCD